MRDFIPTKSPLKSRSIRVSYVEVHKFHFEDLSWASVKIDEWGNGNGELSISSDHGSWSYGWRGTGTATLKDFIIGAGEHYLVDKLVGRVRGEWNPEETKRKIQGEIIENRRHGYYDREEARELWNELECCTWDMGPDIFLNNAPHCLWTSYCELYEMLVYDEPYEVIWLRDSILPFLREYLGWKKEI
jgi:hypothetical protein